MKRNCNRCGKLRELERIVAADSDYYADLCQHCISILRDRTPGFDETSNLPPVPEHIKNAPYIDRRKH